MRSRVWLLAVLFASTCASVEAPGGGPAPGTPGTGGRPSPFGGGGGMGGLVTAGVATGDCVNLQCQQTTCTRGACQQQPCADGQKTTLSGFVYDPAGKTPLYNAVVYVPNADLGAIADGASCDTCDSRVSGRPIAAAQTDSSGRFVLDKAPVGTNIPLVVQVGKWRRKVTIPSVTACVDNPIADKELTRLPRNQAEGHLPLIAVSTGHSDSMDCLLRKIGIADSEFTSDTGGGRVHMYTGGAGMPARQGSTRLASGATLADSYGTLFPNYAKLAGYDMLVLQCEGSQLESSKVPHMATLRRYADGGGRIFTEHLHSYWIRGGLPPWPATAAWVGVGPAFNDSAVTASIDTSFPKGMAFADWLVAVGASPMRGQIALKDAQNSVNMVLPPTQRWIYTDSPATTQYLTFNTPVEAPPGSQCGRVVFTDVHVGIDGGRSTPDQPFPDGCAAATAPLSAQEKALEFMLFDLSSCIQPDGAPPPPIMID